MLAHTWSPSQSPSPYMIPMVMAWMVDAQTSPQNSANDVIPRAKASPQSAIMLFQLNTDFLNGVTFDQLCTTGVSQSVIDARAATNLTFFTMLAKAGVRPPMFVCDNEAGPSDGWRWGDPQNVAASENRALALWQMATMPMHLAYSSVGLSTPRISNDGDLEMSYKNPGVGSYTDTDGNITPFGMYSMAGISSPEMYINPYGNYYNNHAELHGVPVAWVNFGLMVQNVRYLIYNSPASRALLIPWICRPTMRGEPWLQCELVRHLAAMGITRFLYFNPGAPASDDALMADTLKWCNQTFPEDKIPGLPPRFGWQQQIPGTANYTLAIDERWGVVTSGSYSTTLEDYTKAGK